jgi:hypothetical protein
MRRMFLDQRTVRIGPCCAFLKENETRRALFWLSRSDRSSVTSGYLRYKPGSLFDSEQVAYNSLFLGEFAQPDWDMFQVCYSAALL